MTNENVKNFEDNRWKKNNQEMVFRHKEALKMVAGGNVLDIGCGDGLFLEMLKKKSISAKGIDISSEGIKKCKEKNLDATLFDFSKGELPFSDNEFDYVVILDVLEHLFSPEIVLKEARRVSRKYIILSVPNFNSLPARIQMLRGGVPENNTSNKGHVYWFNLKILIDLLNKNSLKVVVFKGNTFFENLFFIGVLTKIAVKIFPSVFALSFILKNEK